MTEKVAIQIARKVAKASGDAWYIVWSPEPQDLPKQHYHVCSEFDLDTFFSGCKVLLYVAPDGSISE